MQDVDPEDLVYLRRDEFLKRVRTAYRELVLTLPEELVDTCRMMCQDNLSLYSPWMNSDDQSS